MSLSECSHGVPGLKGAKVNIRVSPLNRQETVVLSGSKVCSGWKQILQILLLDLFELLP